MSTEPCPPPHPPPNPISVVRWWPQTNFCGCWRLCGRSGLCLWLACLGGTPFLVLKGKQKEDGRPFCWDPINNKDPTHPPTHPWPGTALPWKGSLDFSKPSGSGGRATRRGKMSRPGREVWSSVFCRGSSHSADREFFGSSVIGPKQKSTWWG